MLAQVFAPQLKGILWSPAFSAMVVMRKDFGSHYLTGFTVFLACLFNNIGGWLLNLFTGQGSTNELGIFIGITNFLLLHSWIMCWRTRNKVNTTTSTFPGKTRFRLFWKHIPGASDPQILQKIYEPSLLFIVGMCLSSTSKSLSIWLCFGSFMLAIKTFGHYHTHNKQARQADDLRKIQLETSAGSAL